MMLFGDLKGGGWLTITVDNDKIVLVAKPKALKLALLTTDNMLENVNQDN
jgi:hypothetical protein